jgi:hypothetical protein
MMQSDQINDVAAAIVAAQAELTNPPKSKTVHAGQKKYSFAPLPDILDAIRPVMARHKLAVLQLIRDRVLETRLVHESGQWLGSTYLLPDVPDSQAMGSAITYGRRYSLCAILGIAADDDDDAEIADKAALQAQEDAKEAARARMAERKAGTRHSAYDGRKLEPGEEPTPKPEPEPAGDDLTLVDSRLAELMRKDGITLAALKAYYVGKGHMPASVEPVDLPADYVTGLTRAENWKKAVTAMKGAK